MRLSHIHEDEEVRGIDAEGNPLPPEPYEVLFYVQIYDEHALQPGAGDGCEICKAFPVKSSNPWWDKMIMPENHFDDTEDEYGDPRKSGIFEIRVTALNESQPCPPSMRDIDWKTFQDPNHRYGSIYGYWTNVSSYHGKVREVEIVQNGTYYSDFAWKDFLAFDDKTIWESSMKFGHANGKFILQVPIYHSKKWTSIGARRGMSPADKKAGEARYGLPNVKYLRHVSHKYDENMI